MLTFRRLAGGLVVTHSSEETTLPFANKRPSPSDDEQSPTSIMSGSESDLSEVPEQHPPAAPNPPSLSPTPHKNGFHAEESELSDADDGLDGSDDADFEVDSPPPEPSLPHDVRSSSEESQRPLKRKALGIADDEDIMNNPELYGIRRSVRRSTNRYLSTVHAKFWPATCSPYGHDGMLVSGPRSILT